MNMGDPGISNEFDTCVSCMQNAIRFAPTYDEALQLSVLRLRITRWGEAVKMCCGPRFTLFGLSQPIDGTEPRDAREIMGSLISLFDFSVDKESMSRQSAKPWHTHYQIYKIDEIASRRSEMAQRLLVSLPSRVMVWRRSLIGDACWLIDELDDIFPATQVQRQLFAFERLELPGDIFQYIGSRFPTIDPLISSVISTPSHSSGAIVESGTEVSGNAHEDYENDEYNTYGHVHTVIGYLDDHNGGPDRWARVNDDDDDVDPWAEVHSEWV